MLWIQIDTVTDLKLQGDRKGTAETQGHWRARCKCLPRCDPHRAWRWTSVWFPGTAGNPGLFSHIPSGTDVLVVSSRKSSQWAFIAGHVSKAQGHLTRAASRDMKLETSPWHHNSFLWSPWHPSHSCKQLPICNWVFLSEQKLDHLSPWLQTLQ